MGTPLQGTHYDQSWVDVCNTALRRIGATRISSLTDGTPNQVACSDLLADAIGDVVKKNDDWNCLRAQAVLAVDTGVRPLFDYLYAYVLPGDFRRFIGVSCLDNPPPIIDPLDPHPLPSVYPWKIVGNHLYTNATLVYLWYHRTVVNEDASILPDAFLHAIHAQLALLLAPSLRQDPTLLKELKEDAKEDLMYAIAQDDAGKETPIGSSERGYGYYDEKRGVGGMDPTVDPYNVG